MPDIFWHIAGIVWFFGHLQYNIQGASSLTTDETWELSRFWAKRKIRKKAWTRFMRAHLATIEVEDVQQD